MPNKKQHNISQTTKREILREVEKVLLRREAEGGKEKPQPPKGNLQKKLRTSHVDITRKMMRPHAPEETSVLFFMRIKENRK